jgi:hypothetical protein
LDSAIPCPTRLRGYTIKNGKVVVAVAVTVMVAVW